MDFWVEEIGSTLLPFYFLDCFECYLNGYEYFRQGELVFSYGFVNTEEISEVPEVLVYPNPARDGFIIDTDFFKNIDLRLINLMGKEVFLKTGVERNVEIQIPPKVPEGIYLLEIIFDQDKRVIKKIILE